GIMTALAFGSNQRLDHVQKNISGIQVGHRGSGNWLGTQARQDPQRIRRMLQQVFRPVGQVSPLVPGKKNQEQQHQERQVAKLYPYSRRTPTADARPIENKRKQGKQDAAPLVPEKRIRVVFAV